MVIRYLNIKGVAAFPSEADPPLIVYPDTEFPRSVSLERFQSIARRYLEIVKLFGPVQHQELPPGYTFDCMETPYGIVIKQAFRVPAPEALNHEKTLYCFWEYVNMNGTRRDI